MTYNIIVYVICSRELGSIATEGYKKRPVVAGDGTVGVARGLGCDLAKGGI